MKSKIVVLLMLLILASPLSFGAVLRSMNEAEFEKYFTGKTFQSIPTNTLDVHTYNIFSVYLDGHGGVWGKMSQKPSGEPQADHGSYTVKPDGTFIITWQHWNKPKKLCGHLFETKNAYIIVDCDQVFHSVFMKNASQSGNLMK